MVELDKQHIMDNRFLSEEQKSTQMAELTERKSYYETLFDEARMPRRNRGGSTLACVGMRLECVGMDWERAESLPALPRGVAL